MNRTPEPHLPWYRYPWPWLLMLGPFLVIVAAAVTVWIAIESDDGLVADDYYKQGLAINQENSRNRRAAELGLTAQLTWEAATRIVRVNLMAAQANDRRPEVLILKLSHPTRSDFDQTLRLQRGANGQYLAVLNGNPGEQGGRWYVSLEDDRGDWRMKTLWAASKQPELMLQPDLG